MFGFWFVVKDKVKVLGIFKKKEKHSTVIKKKKFNISCTIRTCLDTST